MHAFLSTTLFPPTPLCMRRLTEYLKPRDPDIKIINIERKRRGTDCQTISIWNVMSGKERKKLKEDQMNYKTPRELHFLSWSSESKGSLKFKVSRWNKVLAMFLRMIRYYLFCRNTSLKLGITHRLQRIGEGKIERFFFFRYVFPRHHHLLSLRILCKSWFRHYTYATYVFIYVAALWQRKSKYRRVIGNRKINLRQMDFSNESVSQSVCPSHSLSAIRSVCLSVSLLKEEASAEWRRNTKRKSRWRERETLL